MVEAPTTKADEAEARGCVILLGIILLTIGGWPFVGPAILLLTGALLIAWGVLAR